MKKQRATDDAVLDAALEAHLRALKMPGALRYLDDGVRHAEADHLDYKSFLVDVLSSELRSREASAINMRIAEARFPEVKTLNDFDFDLVEGVEAAVVAQLASGGYVERHENVVLVGPVGTGKTHLATALGVEACRRRKHVAFYRAADLVRQLVEAKDARELGRLERRLDRCEVLVLDELGFVPFERQGGELLFNVLSRRHHRRSTVVTTNLAFSEWPAVFGGDEKLTAALLDRLAETSTVLTTRGKSFRMRKRGSGSKAA